MDAGAGVILDECPTLEQRHSDLKAMADRLAATAESVAVMLEDLARTRDSLADNSRAESQRLRDSAQRARTMAATERLAAEGLRRAGTPEQGPTPGAALARQDAQVARRHLRTGAPPK